MKKNIYKIWKGCLLCALLSIGASCTRQDLEYRIPAGYVVVDLSWEGGIVPSGSRFWFFPVNGGEVIVREASGEGFSGTLPPGDYRVIAANLDAKHIDFRNMDRYETAELYVLSDETSADPCLCQPGNLYLCSGEESTLLTVPDRDTVKLNLSPRSRVRQVRLKVTVDDPRIASCSGLLSGVSSSIHCATASCTGHPARVGFTASPDEGAGTFRADISVLDLIRPGSDPVHLAEVTLMREDGTAVPVTVDLTDAVREQIEGAGGTLPDEISLAVSFHTVNGELKASVEPWDTGGSGSGEL